MYFGIIAIVNGLVAVRCLQTRRPATFFLAANQLLVCRAFARIADLGQPLSQSYLPRFLFSEGQLAIAQNLFLISTAVLVVSAIFKARKPESPPPPMPALPRWLIVLLGVYICLLVASSQTILERAYSDMDRYRFHIDFIGGSVLIFSLILYEVVRRVQAGQMVGWKGLALIFTIFLLTYFLKGGTGLATGYVLCAAILMLGKKKDGRSAWIKLMVIGLSLGALVTVIRSVRAILHAEGLDAVVRVVTEGVENQGGIDTATPTGLVEGNLNGIESASHVLMCVALWESGSSRKWRSVSDVISYTFKPRFLADRLGWKRSIDAPWELIDNFFHWGGINILGEFYWNGGYLCVLVLWPLVVLFAFLCDTRWETSFAWLMLLCQFAPTVLMGVGYGFNQTSRGAINGLLVLGIYWIWKRVASRPMETGRFHPGSGAPGPVAVS